MQFNSSPLQCTHSCFSYTFFFLTYSFVLVLIQTNTYFQALVHDAKAWRSSSVSFEKQVNEEKARGDELAEKLAAKEKELEAAYAKVVVLEEQKDKAVDDYLASEEYAELLLSHDDSYYPTPFEHGWVAAVKALKATPSEMIADLEFPCPEDPLALLSSEKAVGDTPREERVPSPAKETPEARGSSSGSSSSSEEEAEREAEGESSSSGEESEGSQFCFSFGPAWLVFSTCFITFVNSMVRINYRLFIHRFFKRGLYFPFFA